MQKPEFQARVSERHSCDIAASACTTLENRAARIVDLSLHGAQVRIEEPYEQGQQIHLDIDGEYVWGTVAWAEIDRMGVKFTHRLQTESVLHRRLEDIRRRTMLGATAHQRQRPVFGRRAA